MAKLCPTCDASYNDDDTFCERDGATLVALDSHDELIKRSFGNYELTALLGKGGMGRVYLASHKTLKHKAAIKILNLKMLSIPDAAERFKREARSAHKLDHENVVRVFDFGEEADGLLYLVMEYVPGRSLRAIIERDGALALPRTASIISQVARGLDAAHQLKIIHRDVKPDNIMVIEGANGVDRVKIVDFGIARVFDTSGDEGASTEDSLTAFNSVVGTPEYMSPEQLTGERLDARSDVYSLALVAYQCLVAKSPFAGESPTARAWARLTNGPLRLAELVPGTWSDALQHALDLALSRAPNDRPASAGAFAQQLSDAVAADTRTTETAGTPWWQTPRRAAVLVGAALLLAVPSVYAWNKLRNPNPRPVLVREEPPKPPVDANGTRKSVEPPASVIPTREKPTDHTTTKVPNTTKLPATRTEASRAKVEAMRSWLAASDRRLSDQSSSDLTGAADSVLTLFRRVKLMQMMLTTDDSVRAYLVWASAMLRRRATDDVQGACTVLNEARAQHLQPHAQTLRLRYEASLQSCRNE